MQLYHIRGFSGFAATYGCSAYGSGSYNTSTACGASTSPESGSNLLVNTGIAVSLIVGAACLLLLIAMLVRFWRRPAKPTVKTVAASADQPHSSSDLHK